MVLRPNQLSYWIGITLQIYFSTLYLPYIIIATTFCLLEFLNIWEREIWKEAWLIVSWKAHAHQPNNNWRVDYHHIYRVKITKIPHREPHQGPNCVDPTPSKTHPQEAWKSIRQEPHSHPKQVKPSQEDGMWWRVISPLKLMWVFTLSLIKCGTKCIIQRA